VSTRRLQVLFLLALLGVLVAVGLVVADAGGPAAAAAYAALVLALLVVGAVRARRAAEPRRPVQHCACCDGDHTAPVQVVR
jgi:hypothetical protein